MRLATFATRPRPELVTQLGFQWLAAKTGATFLGPPIVSKIFLGVAGAQPFVHAIVIGGIVLLATAYFSGMTRARDEIEGLAYVQEQLDSAIAECGSTPESLRELAVLKPGVSRVLEDLGETRFRLTKRGDRGYELVLYRGRDANGVADEVSVINGVALRKILNEYRNKQQ